jgi:hypothetical protein
MSIKKVVAISLLLVSALSELTVAKTNEETAMEASNSANETTCPVTSGLSIGLDLGCMSGKHRFKIVEDAERDSYKKKFNLGNARLNIIYDYRFKNTPLVVGVMVGLGMHSGMKGSKTTETAVLKTKKTAKYAG